MKLISKECPNCGAKLSFHEGDERVNCSYCKQVITIQKEKPKDKYYENYEEDENGSSYTLYIEKNYDSLEDMEKISRDRRMETEIRETVIHSSPNVLSPFFSFSRKKVIIIVLYILACLVFCISRNEEFRSMFHKEEVRSGNHIKNISQIDGKSLYTLKSASISALNTRKDSLPAPSRSGSWEYLGMYLLVSKESFKDNNSMLYVVCKKENEVDRKNSTYYGVAVYDNLRLSDSGIQVPSDVSPLIILPKNNFPNDTYRYVNGYGNMKVLYDQVIKTKIDMYDVMATSGMYVE